MLFRRVDIVNGEYIIKHEPSAHIRSEEAYMILDSDYRVIDLGVVDSSSKTVLGEAKFVIKFINNKCKPYSVTELDMSTLSEHFIGYTFVGHSELPYTLNELLEKFGKTYIRSVLKINVDLEGIA